MEHLISYDIPYWIWIVRHFLKKDYVYNGLTLPFLIGARTIVEPGLPLLTIAEFVQQAATHPAGTTIMHCGNIGEYVFAEMDVESRKHAHYYLNLGEFYFIDHSFERIHDLAELTNRFTALYADLLQQQRYSRESGQWVPFFSIDLQRLQEVSQEPRR
jgi:hypothetical protein